MQGNIRLPINCALLLLATSDLAMGQAAATVERTGAAATPSVIITLNEAIHRAEANEPTYATLLAGSKVAGLDRSIARNGLLPSVVYHNQYLYTQANGLQTQAGQGATSQAAPKFIANNAVREYASHAAVNETMGLAGVAGVLMLLRPWPLLSLKFRAGA